MGCNIDDAAVIVLAAGDSGRMGFPKPLLRFNDDECFLEHIINKYCEVDIGQIIVVVNPLLYSIFIRRDFPFLKQISLILNPEPERGRLYSIQLGLSATNSDQYCFIQNVDQPFIDTGLLVSLAAKSGNESYAAPFCDGKCGHPVLIGPGIIQIIKDCTDDHATLKELLDLYAKKQVPVKDKLVCVNINTAVEYRKYFSKKPETV